MFLGSKGAPGVTSNEAHTPAARSTSPWDFPFEALRPNCQDHEIYVLLMYHLCSSYVIFMLYLCFTYVSFMFYLCFTYVLEASRRRQHRKVWFRVVFGGVPGDPGDPGAHLRARK